MIKSKISGWEGGKNYYCYNNNNNSRQAGWAGLGRPIFNTINTTKSTQRKMPDMAFLGKRMNSHYKQKVNEPDTPAKMTKAQHNKKMKFLESMDKYDREKWWAAYMAGKVKPPGGIKL